MFTKKNFTFNSPYSLKKCNKVLRNMESGWENLSLVEFKSKNDASFIRLESRYLEYGRPLAIAEAEIWLSTTSTGATHVLGHAKIFLAQLTFYFYFLIVSTIFVMIFRSVPILILFLGVFVLWLIRLLRIIIHKQKLSPISNLSNIDVNKFSFAPNFIIVSCNPLHV